MTPTEVITTAAKHGWEAMLLSFFATAVVGLLIWLMKAWSNEAHHREERMAKRIDELESFTRTTLLEALQDNNKALIALTSALNSRTCLLNPDSQNKVVAQLVRELADRIK